MRTGRKSNIWKKSAGVLTSQKEEDCVPSISTELKKFYCSFWGVPMEDFSQINREYDQLMLDLEEDLLSAIRYSADPLRAALIYARTGNYIDFAALPEVSKETALSLIKSENKDELDEQEYRNFCQDMKKASNVVYITDNCGEIVLDKIAIQILKKTFPNIRVTALVRGAALPETTLPWKMRSSAVLQILYRCLVTAAMWEVPGFMESVHMPGSFCRAQTSF